MAAASTGLLEGLERSGRITSAQRQAVRARVDQGGMRVEDALVELGVLSEASVLEALALGQTVISDGAFVDEHGTSAIELTHVLVSLLESQRAELSGHSAQVSRLLMRVAEHMGLPSRQLFGVRLAGLLHDVGKSSGYHLTALNVAEYEGHRTQACLDYLKPVRLFEAADLPTLTIDALQHMYERVDGKGFPDRRAGNDIPLAARLLAVAETYADLTTNTRNPFRARLSPRAAAQVLDRYVGRVFDGHLVDLFCQATLGDDLPRRGVRGSLREMPLPDVLQVLGRTRKTGRLTVQSRGQVGEIHVCEGEVHSAVFMHERGEDAVYTMLKLEDGEFALEPDVEPAAREIHSALESLLLEGMRRLDEGEDFGATGVE